MLRRIFGLIGLGLMASSSSIAVAQGVPAHWLSYAEMVGNQIREWLSDPVDERVQRLHGWMQQRMLEDGRVIAPSSIVVRMWVAPSGSVEHVEFASLGSAQADMDLSALLTDGSLMEPPPPDMKQPMVLRLSLEFLQKA